MSIGTCALYFSDHNSIEQKVLSEILCKVGMHYMERPLLDYRADEDDKQASLLLYSCCAIQNTSGGEQNRIKLRDVYVYYIENIGPQFSSDGDSITTLDMGNMISELQADEMWDLYNNKFDFLGEGHPISMQDSKDDFFKLLRSKNTIIAATYLIGADNNINKLACFTYFIDDMDQLYWLNQGYLDEKFSVYAGFKGCLTNIFTPGIVSSGSGGHYSFLPISLFARAGDTAGLNASVLFENTNFSKRYVPRIVETAMGKTCKNTVAGPSIMVDKVTYRLWSISNSGGSCL